MLLGINSLLINAIIAINIPEKIDNIDTKIEIISPLKLSYPYQEIKELTEMIIAILKKLLTIINERAIVVQCIKVLF